MEKEKNKELDNFHDIHDDQERIYHFLNSIGQKEKKKSQFAPKSIYIITIFTIIFISILSISEFNLLTLTFMIGFSLFFIQFDKEDT